jgi:hypothetical protein
MVRKVLTYLEEWWQDRVIPGWVVSLVAHTALLLTMMLITVSSPPRPTEASLESQLTEIPEEIPLQEVPLEPLPLEPLDQPELGEPHPAPTSAVAADLPQFQEPAPLSPVELPPLDALAAPLQGLSPAGLAAQGSGSIFASRGEGARRTMLGSQGGTKLTELSVQAGLDWLVRHQFPDGHWSLDHRPRCSRAGCSGASQTRSDMAATALGVLPFLAANYTHRTGPHRAVVNRALNWMLLHQQPNGHLHVPGQQQPMYTHGLATLAICEAYALTKDPRLGAAGQRAVAFLAATQNAAGGWRYEPNSKDVDTSVFGWQVMALKSAQIAGLKVPPEVFEGCRKYLQAAAQGKHGGLFGYMPGHGATPAMTSVGLLCLQYFGTPRKEPAMVEGINYLMANLPSETGQRDAYYWYYATMVIHNFQGPHWDRWNRLMRRLWVESQHKDQNSCEFGSWSPQEVRWGDAGGRHFVTCVGLLTLEVYYRYLPLYGVVEEIAETTPSADTSTEKGAR